MSYIDEYTEDLKEKRIYEYRKKHKNCNWCHFYNGGFKSLDNPKIYIGKSCELKSVFVKYTRLKAFFCTHYWAKGRNE